MNYVTFARNARRKTKTTTTTFSDQDMVDIVNGIVERLTPMIVKADENAFQMVSTRDLIAGQRQYVFPTDIAKRITKVEVKFQDKWVIATETDINMIEVPLADETLFAQQFSNSPVKFSMFRNCINLYTGSDIESVTDGLRLYYTVYPYPWTTSDLASSVDISVDPSAVAVGFPRIFHEVLLPMTTKEYKEEKQIPLPLTTSEQNAENLFISTLKTFKGMNRDRVLASSYPIEDGIF